MAELAGSYRCFRMDRRGFSGSGDTGDYTIEREYDDVVAVAEGVAETSGSPVALFGHSYGANCALGGATRSQRVSHLVLYEPSLGLHYPDGTIEAIEEALERGNRDAAISEVLSGLLAMTPDEIDSYRQGPAWPDRLRAAHTIPRECRAEQENSFASKRIPVAFPTLVLVGTDTTDELAAVARDASDAIIGSELRILDGLDHMAPRYAPATVAAELRSFLERGADA